MIHFMFSPGNTPFIVALGLMLLMTFMEGAGTLMGLSISGMLDTLIPDFDVDIDVDIDVDMDVDVDVDVDAGVDTGELGGAGALSRVLGWLCVGKVPFLILLLLFLSTYGVIGLAGQYVIQGSTGHMFPATLAGLAALAPTIPAVHFLGGLLAKILPDDESEAESEANFIGRTAVITLGKASSGKPAEAKLRDKHGQTHYVMVEPDLDKDEFTAGAEVLIVKQTGSTFRVILNNNPALSNQ